MRIKILPRLLTLRQLEDPKGLRWWSPRLLGARFWRICCWLGCLGVFRRAEESRGGFGRRGECVFCNICIGGEADDMGFTSRGGGSTVSAVCHTARLKSSFDEPNQARQPRKRSCQTNDQRLGVGIAPVYACRGVRGDTWD